MRLNAPTAPPITASTAPTAAPDANRAASHEPEEACVSPASSSPPPRPAIRSFCPAWDGEWTRSNCSREAGTTADVPARSARRFVPAPAEYAAHAPGVRGGRAAESARRRRHRGKKTRGEEGLCISSAGAGTILRAGFYGANSPDYGPTTERLRADYGATTGRLRSDYGPTTERLRADYGATTGRLRSDLRQMSERRG